MNRTASWIGGMAFALALVVSCGTVPQDIVNGMADMLGIDGVGNGQGDGNSMVGDAKADTPAMSLPCDKTTSSTSTTVNGANTTVTTSITYWAEFLIAGLDPTMVPNVSAVTCGPVRTGIYAGYQIPSASPCNGAANCVNGGTYTNAVSADCIQTTPYLSAGKVMVYCGNGSDTKVNGVQAANSPSDFRYQTAYLKQN